MSGYGGACWSEQCGRTRHGYWNVVIGFREAERADMSVRRPTRLVVILQPQMRNQFLALQVPQRVLQLHQLNKQVMLGIQPRRGHRRLEVEAQPLLNAEPAQHWRSLCQVKKEHQVEHDWRGQN